MHTNIAWTGRFVKAYPVKVTIIRHHVTHI